MASSKTGLQPAEIFPVNFEQNISAPDLQPLTGRAPVVHRPFAGIHNPFPHGCSVLCNHPADIIGYQRKLLYFKEHNKQETRASFLSAPAPTDDFVPEELFRKYTETDSRPVTPAPTLASIQGSHRKCVTPDPAARTLLVLDLRRSQSQEMLSWRGIVTPAVLSPNPHQPKRVTQHIRVSPARNRAVAAMKRTLASSPVKHPISVVNSSEQVTNNPVIITEQHLLLSAQEDNNIATPRRRGLRRRRRKQRDGAASPEKQEFKGLDEPGETQISAMGEGEEMDTMTNERMKITETNNSNSATHITNTNKQNNLQTNTQKINKNQTFSSFLHEEIIRRLQRHLNWEDIETEFNLKKRTALEEAIKMPKLRHTLTDIENKNDGKHTCYTVPRAFSRRSARFELPLDSRKLKNMKPFYYLSKYVAICDTRLKLYNDIFNKFRQHSGIENEPRIMENKNITSALSEVIGQNLLPEQLNQLKNLINLDWDNSKDYIDFRTFAGLSAFTERIFGSLLPCDQDPPFELELCDFQRLHSKINQNCVISNLLLNIKNATIE